MNPCTILLVEDDENDAFLFERTLRRLGYDGHIVRKNTVVAAWQWLNGSVPEASSAPDLIVSDCVHEQDGRGDLLEWLRVHPRYQDVPFAIFTGGMTSQKTREFEARGALVLIKPVSLDELVEVLRPALLQLPEHCRPWLKD